MIAYFTNEKEEKTSINRWYNFDYNNSNKNIENIAALAAAFLLWNECI
jgi:hypothetical protein